MGPYVQLLGRKGIDRGIPCPIWLQFHASTIKITKYAKVSAGLNLMTTEDVDLLECDAMPLTWWFPTVRRNIVPSSLRTKQSQNHKLDELSHSVTPESSATPMWEAQITHWLQLISLKKRKNMEAQCLIWKVKLINQLIIQIMFVWIVTPCTLICRNKRFGETCYLHL